jgi:hypothetical protein
MHPSSRSHSHSISMHRLFSVDKTFHELVLTRHFFPHPWWLPVHHTLDSLVLSARRYSGTSTEQHPSASQLGAGSSAEAAMVDLASIPLHSCTQSQCHIHIPYWRREDFGLMRLSIDLSSTPCYLFSSKMLIHSWNQHHRIMTDRVRFSCIHYERKKKIDHLQSARWDEQAPEGMRYSIELLQKGLLSHCTVGPMQDQS